MISAEVRNITPEMAFELLTKNTKNYRRIHVPTVKYYAKEMQEGRWEMNGEPIQFAEDGTLLNGQHRLTAIVESGVTVPLLVVTGVKKDVAIYDDGKTRSPMDVASNLGIQANSRILAVANLMIAADMNPGSRHRVSKRDQAMYAGQHIKALKLAQAATASGGRPALMDRAWATGVAYMLIRDGKDHKTLCDYFMVINTGLPLVGRECSSALIIRNMFYAQAALTRKMDEPDNMHFLMLGFGDFANGIRRKRTYAMQTIMVNRAEELWHKIRKEDGLE